MSKGVTLDKSFTSSPLRKFKENMTTRDSLLRKLTAECSHTLWELLLWTYLQVNTYHEYGKDRLVKTKIDVALGETCWQAVGCLTDIKVEEKYCLSVIAQSAIRWTSSFFFFLDWERTKIVKDNKHLVHAEVMNNFRLKN